MKSLKRAVLAVLVLNLLAVLGGAGWLFTSGRVSKGRVLDLTQLFDEPVAAERSRLKAEQAAAAALAAAQEKPLPTPALSTAERNQVRVEMTQIDRERLERMRREVADLQGTLRKERRLLEEGRAALEKEREDFDQMRQRLANLEGGKQFKKSLATITGMDAKDAKTVLSAMLGEPSTPGGKYEEVISYLSAMDDRARTEILTQFVKAGEDRLAADLLESVRLRGLETTKAGGISP